jgi:CDP-diglyceride synthetase
MNPVRFGFAVFCILVLVGSLLIAWNWYRINRKPPTKRLETRTPMIELKPFPAISERV